MSIKKPSTALVDELGGLFIVEVHNDFANFTCKGSPISILSWYICWANTRLVCSKIRTYQQDTRWVLILHNVICMYDSVLIND